MFYFAYRPDFPVLGKELALFKLICYGLKEKKKSQILLQFCIAPQFLHEIGPGAEGSILYKEWMIDLI